MTTRKKILNPATGRMVYADGGVGKSITSKAKASPKPRSPTKAKATKTTKSPTKTTKAKASPQPKITKAKTPPKTKSSAKATKTPPKTKNEPQVTKVTAKLHYRKGEDKDLWNSWDVNVTITTNEVSSVYKLSVYNKLHSHTASPTAIWLDLFDKFSKNQEYDEPVDMDCIKVIVQNKLSLIYFDIQGEIMKVEQVLPRSVSVKLINLLKKAILKK